MDEKNVNTQKLKYTIHYCSSYAPNYSPTNIMEDKPHDQTSRWSSETNYPPQYLILKLDTPALVDSITFGKFDKTHICNLKKFKVFIGMTDTCTLEVLSGGLRNDSTPETFDIRATIEGKRVPCLYIKLSPLVCWGPSFNLSIWYVALCGEQDPTKVGPYVEWYLEYEEKEVVKLCLKHFRQHGYLSSFNTLMKETGVCLEDPKMTKLYDLVLTGRYEDVENFMQKAVAEGLFREYIHKQMYRPLWSPVGDTGGVRPGMRGGHQMCVDPNTEIVYLLGGWDGHQDMGDFWAYHVPSAKWTLISKDTSLEGGPSPRSCHKMVLDTERRQLFVLGRYVDTQCRSHGPLLSDFYLFDIGTNSWTLITEDTASMGGPQLLFDHQMAFDVQKRTLYVFGGRVLTTQLWKPEEATHGLSELKFSGLYSYQVATNTWTLLFDDSASWVKSGTRKLKSRVGHSMLFHPGSRKLFIFGGQRSKEYIHDLFTYDVDSDEACIVVKQSEPQTDGTIPSSGFTQRATIDQDLDEIYVLSGLSKDKEKRDDNVQYSLWVYSIRHNRWTCIHKNENVGDEYWTKMQRVEPCPRFAHQFVYDHIHKVHYLFGGNPGRTCLPKLRLDDFWKLHLTQPSERQLLHKFKFLIRRHRFEELALDDRLAALEYLQQSVYDTIDHDDAEQTKEFQLLTSLLFQAADRAMLVPRPVSTLRDSLYNQLVNFFPITMVQPKGNLLDVLSVCKDHSSN